jgi:prepilin-type N-terminal cleavage/methylation domain-containing protein
MRRTSSNWPKSFPKDSDHRVSQTGNAPPLQRGFSIIELTAVMVIALILAAMVGPSIITSVRNVRMRTSASETAALLQQARLRAIRLNTYVTVRAATVGTSNYVYMDTTGTGSTDGSGNGSYDAGEIADQLESGVKFKQSGNPAFDTAGLLGYTPYVNDYDMHVSFNQRGMPCVMSGSVCVNISGGNPVGFLYFLNDGSTRWSAVSVSPAGRIKTWSYTGTTWK